ncbi:MAG: DUF2442 domain-containing protein [Solirubrobacteraceae bacterium]
MVLRVTDVEALDGYRLRITFNDGAVRDGDFAEDLARAGGTLAEPLRDLDYFRQVRVDEQLRTIVWPNGLDADPDVLYGDRAPVEPISLAGERAA